MRRLFSLDRVIPILILTLGAVLTPAIMHAVSYPVPPPFQTVPWHTSQVITPQALAKKLALPKDQRPVIVCVGFSYLYKGGHIPGALYKGPGREASGLEQLMTWAHSIPKDTPVVIYCGCCPVSRCPNIRPAFEALRTAGLTNIRVLDLPQSFVQDWTQEGYPTQKQQ
ncbi:MAG TPA: rhodanese-like domain-containing protein [Terriglobia bacterium]|nr:rhodanese-like domain-containing protein [Terriglobia bacterium]